MALDLGQLLDAPARWAVLDRVSAFVTPVGLQLRASPVGDLLAGRPLGHPLHPAVAVAPLGLAIAAAQTSADESSARASRRLLGTALASAPLAIATGLVEMTTLDREGKRVAVAHLGLNVVGNVLQVSAFVRRSRPLLLAGVAVSGAAASLGGHLGYRYRARLVEPQPWGVPVRATGTPQVPGDL